MLGIKHYVERVFEIIIISNLTWCLFKKKLVAQQARSIYKCTPLKIPNKTVILLSGP